MARCKLTSMNLRTIRKSREYQALLIDLVAMGVVGQSAAEGILGYTIPAGLLGNATTGGETGGETGGSTEPTPIVVPVKVAGGSASPITVGTYTIPSSWEDIDYSLGDTDTYVFGDNFTPNENWDPAYGNSAVYTLDSITFRDTNNAIAWETAPSELPEDAFIVVILNPVSSSSSS